jgi:hypothetical protein
MGLAEISLMADLATTAAAVMAAAGLWLTWRALEAQARSVDLDNLIALSSSVREAEGRINEAVESDREREFLNYFNLVEIYAAAVNHNLLSGVSAEVAKDRLASDIGIFSASEEARSYLESAITSPNTFAEMQVFYRRNRERIQAGTRREMLRTEARE